MKIVYYIGQKIDSDTIVTKGLLDDDTQQMFIEWSEGRYIFNDIRQVDIVKINLGTMVKVINGEDTIFLAVPCIFINKGTGFMIINSFATKKVGKLLSIAMHYQKDK